MTRIFLMRTISIVRKTAALSFFALCLAACATVSANIQLPPKPAGSVYVQDYAGLLAEDTKREINRVGRLLDQTTKAQIVVVTARSLDGVPIDAYALELLRAWGVGDQTRNNGVVFLISPNDRASRIEVGYGLEGALPDAKTGQIQDELVLPYFKKGDFNGGILNGYLGIARIVAEEYKTAPPDLAPPAKAANAEEGGVLDRLMTPLAFAGLILLVILDLTFFGGRFTALLLLLLRSRGGGGGGFGGGSGGGGGSGRKW